MIGAEECLSAVYYYIRQIWMRLSVSTERFWPLGLLCEMLQWDWSELQEVFSCLSSYLWRLQSMVIHNQRQICSF